jgi:hypothetical protein
MNVNELHAYIMGPSFSDVVGWVRLALKCMTREEVLDLTKELDMTIQKFDGKSETLVLEQRINSEWLELTIRTNTDASKFADWDNITLGELLVDDLGGITLVDCRGEYTNPMSDDIVRVSADKIELVRLPDTLEDPFDESLTRFIRSR